MRRRRAIAWSLFALTLGLVAATLTGPGITWDEPAYFGSAQRHAAWVRQLLAEGPAVALDRDTVRELWDWEHYWNPHPPVYREGMALTWSLARGWLGDLAAFRLFSALCFAATVALLYRWGARAWSDVAGLGAALATLAMPRLFAHAHLAATEIPLTAWWALATAGGWWAVERDRRAGWALAGLGWGLAAGTKFTGLAVVVPLAVWAAWRRPRELARGLPLAAATAVTVFVALNPRMWVDAPAFLSTWLWESLHREAYAPISTFYLGRQYGFDVPWHHTIVITAAVTPLGILALAAFGAVRGLARRPEPTVVLAAGTVLFFWLLFLFPQAPHHNGERQFLPVFPFVGLIAGYGLHRVRALVGVRGAALAGALALLPPALKTAALHPYYLAYYGEAVGGVRGANALGLETTYWLDVVADEAFDWMDRELPPAATIHVGTTVPLELAQTQGRVRRDLHFTAELPADYLLVPMNQGVFTPGLWRVVQRAAPLFTVEREGVVLLALYRFR